MFLAALAGLVLMPVAGAQIGTTLRVGDAAADSEVVGEVTDADIDTRKLRERIGTADPTGATAGLTDGLANAVPVKSGDIRLHTSINDRTVTRLVTSALEVPEVRDLLGSRARLDVAVDKQHFQVDIAGGKVQSTTATDSVANADYIIRAGTDAARSLANAADPAFTATKLLQRHYITVEAAKFTHQAGLKAFFSGALDSRIDVKDRLEDVQFEGEATAAEQAILASGLRIVRFDGRLFAANDLGALVATLHEGTRALGEPPAELNIRFTGIAGGGTTDRAQLVALVRQSAEADAIAEWDEEHYALLEQQGAPDAFSAGLRAQINAARALEQFS